LDVLGKTIQFVKNEKKAGSFDLKERLFSWFKNLRYRGLIPFEKAEALEEIIRQALYEDVEEAEEKRGVMDFTGRIIIEPGQYDYVESHQNGFARVSLGKKYGFIDEAYRLVIPIKFDVAGTFESNGLCFAKVGEQKGLIDATGEFVFPSDYQIDVRDGCCVVIVGAKSGVMERDGSYLLPIEYDSIGEDGSYFYPKKNGQFGMAARGRGLIFDCRYEAIAPCGDGRFVYTEGSKCGFLDENGSEIGALPFDMVHPLKLEHETILRVKLQDKWGVADALGNVLITPDFNWDDIRLFSRGGGMFRKNGYWAIVSPSWNFVSDYVYDSIEDGARGFLIVGVVVGTQQVTPRKTMEINRYGLISSWGDVLLEPSCAQIRHLS
jgi:hypothetical protein